ncbi:MAG TPA: fructosamine kinase family protein [Tepidisphaeraceae bacterium]|jgi:fructosamine-3-kinase
MTPQVEVSWQVLRQIVQDWAGEGVELDEVTPLFGGAINTTLRLTTKCGQKSVLKITPHRVDRSYEDEVLQLELLREVGLPVPRIYQLQTGSLEKPFSYLLMEFVEGVDLAVAKSQCSAGQFDQLQEHLAELVLLMHERRSPTCMRVTAAEPKRYEQWHEFFRDVFDPIWREVDKSGVLPVKSRKAMSRIHDRLDRLIQHDDGARLTHWDLWATNVLARPDDAGRWRVAAILDPNCKYAHAEAEIAYLELFHTVTPAFMRAYQQVHKIEPEYYRVRRQVYQLYSLLNHLHLFGQEYLKSMLAMLDRVGTVI